MKRLHAIRVFIAVLAFAAVSASAQMIPPPPGAFTHTVKSGVTSGFWDDPLTWLQNSVPVAGSVVDIPAGKTVTLRTMESAHVTWIQVEGTLALSTTANTRLTVETLYIKMGGVFTIGTSTANFVPANLKAEVVFCNNGAAVNYVWDMEQVSRGLISEGKVRVFGAPKTYMKPVIANVRRTTSTITVSGAVPTDWAPSDSVVLTGTYFRRGSPAQDERMTIGTLNGSTITTTSPFVYDHMRAGSMNLHLANLTRNVIFRSDSVSPAALRGHVMIMNGDANIQNATFNDLGRTDKSIRLDDVQVINNRLENKPTDQIGNRRGRYSLHFHKNQYATMAVVKGCVVNGTVGWGFVNHKSNVDFEQNVAYNFTGAGFVTEDGDEIGNFIDNIAIHGSGDGNYYKQRIVFGNAYRPQPISDFAFDGDGFWFQGPALHVRNNVANSCNGAGMIWHTTGQVDVASALAPGSKTPPVDAYGAYTYFLRSRIQSIYTGFPGYSLSTFIPRYWRNDPNLVIISDLPILECNGLESYANLVGFRLRFNNYNNVDWYDEAPYGYDADITPIANNDKKAMPSRLRQQVLNLSLWNDEQAFSTIYAMKTDFNNVQAINRLDYDETAPYANPSLDPVTGAMLEFQIQQMTFTNLLIDGWEVAGFIESGVRNQRAQVTFIPPKTYVNYANPDIWDTTTTCGAPLNPTGSATSQTTAHLSWTANGAVDRYVVRYKAGAEQQWTYWPPTTATAVNLTGLLSGRTYTWQVISGCSRSPSQWTGALTFPTP